ncbi:putative vesicular acetylcholine transporter-B isoform X3 [Styela clava]|uniref:probable vesicular acetylcholine transporter-B isoform X3 n=1 Tax=Styela clava TaxID=7725 RepID=UPI00193A87C8|nr:probable vesicular acetylcholine transporter-B isoform X3 [Styela clava]
MPLTPQGIIAGIFMMPGIIKSCAFRVVAYLRQSAAPVRTRFSSPRWQKRIIQFIVCLALLLDNMLYMVIVPIIDDYFSATESKTTLPFEDVTTTRPIDVRFAENHSIVTINTTSNYVTSKNTKFLGKLEDKLRNLHPVKIQDNQDALMGLLFASKAIVQLTVNPFTGAFIDRVGYITPLTLGLMVMFFSTVVFAFAQSYAWLFIARSLQGFGSALADTASFGLIADRFQNEGERSKALGIALAFISFGSLVAPPFGGILYEFVGKPMPFFILAIACLFDASLLLLVEAPTDDEEGANGDNKVVGTPIYKLLMDPYILVIAGSLSIANFPLAFLEPTIAEWMQENMNAVPWQIGLIWLPPFLPHVLGVYLTVKLSVKYFRLQWFYGLVGLIAIGISAMIVPVCKSYGALIVPLCFMCFGIALIDTALLPTLAFLVDVRHTSVYGSVYAIADISYSVAYALGPILAGQAVQSIGYTEMNVLIGMANVCFAPVLFTLRKVYDWNVNRGERDMLLSEVGEYHRFNNNGHTSTGSLDEGKLKSEHTIVGNNHNGSVIDAEEHLKSLPSEKSDLRLTSDSQKRTATSRQSLAAAQQIEQKIVQTDINPRPRPRPRRLSREARLETEESNDIQNEHDEAIKTLDGE